MSSPTDRPMEDEPIEGEPTEGGAPEVRSTEVRSTEVGPTEGCQIPAAPDPDGQALDTPAFTRPAFARPTFDRRAFRKMSRRELFKLAPVAALGAFAIPSLRTPLLKAGLATSDWISSKLYRTGHLARTYTDAELTPPDKFPINGYDVDDPEVDFAAWSLTVSGAVQKPGDYKLPQIQALPKIIQNTRHVCVEGWDVIGRFGGARLSDFLKSIGADLNARFLTVECADDYYETIDMATALHPQSLLCYEMYDQPLTREHGAPLRLSIPTKVGYKQAKYLTDLKVTNVVQRYGYWEDQGYSEFYGL